MNARVLAAAALALAAACRRSEPAAPPAASGKALVFAASSLTGAFKAVKEAFERAHAGAAVEFNFAGSPQLVAQIEQGAPADVFASADEPTMQRVVDGGFADAPPRIFARNALAIAVEPPNRMRVTGLADLARADLKVALCAPAVPAGRYAREALAKAGVAVKPVSEEPNVSALTGKVSLGEVDAGVVYVTDVAAAGAKVTGVEIPEAQNVIARYPIAVLKTGTNRDAAKAFVELVVSEEGRRILESFGFRHP